MKNLLLALFAFLLLGCKKEYDAPPVRQLQPGEILTLSDLRAMFTGNPIAFDSSYSVYGVVTADERNGNLYRNVFLQDGETAINVRLQTPGGLYQGDSIRIDLAGTVLSSYSEMLQLDSVSVDNNIIKQATNVNVAPVTVTIADINPSLQARLIRLENVQFVPGDTSKTWADAPNQASRNLYLQDCDGNTVLVRTSGFADFAGEKVPAGNGSFVAIVGQFNDDMQLYVRSMEEVDFTGARCDLNQGGGELCAASEAVSEDFAAVTNNADLNFECWHNVAEVGSRKWRWRIFEDENVEDRYVQVNAYQSSDAENVSWLISPPVAFYPNLSLSFSTACAFYTHNSPGLRVYVSADYNGSNLSSATWIQVSAPIQNQGNYEWLNSGNVPLAGYFPQGFTGNIVVAFRYRGNSTNGETTTYTLDNFQLQ